MDLSRLIGALRTTRVNGVGIRDWSAYAVRTRQLVLAVKDRQPGNAHAPMSLAESARVTYVLVWVDGRVSRGSLERRQAEQPGDALAAARASAYEDPDAAQVAAPSGFREVRLHDAGAAAVAGGDATALLERMKVIREIAERPESRTWSGSLHASESTVRLVSSAGLDVSEWRTRTAWHASLDGEIGVGHASRTLDALPECAARMERLAGLARRLREPAAPIRGGVHPVILHPDVVEELFIDTLLQSLDGAALDHGHSHFRREQVGSADAVLREDLTLRLDPLLPLRSGAYRFTPEGVPAARCTYIAQGRLVTPILDLKYGRRLELPPTPLPCGLDTLFLEGPEPLSGEEAWGEAEGGALVLNVLGVHTLDASSGDFSLAAPQSLRVGSGGLEGRLRLTLSGNVFALLRSEPLRLVRFEGEHTPGLLLRCRVDPR